ncbi:MAG: hypothetical protein JSV24_08610 [Bacteroidales bacterium]|nr:MAG: hypothetical protein JSV24_08610 [Bacteroidales bacterium]
MKLKISKFNLILCSILLLSSVACRKSLEGKFREGEIHYRISYLESKIGMIPVEALPKEMTMKFKDDAVITEIDGIFGYFNISNVTNSRKSDNMTYLKIMNKKFYFEGRPDEIAPGFHKMNNMIVEYVEGEKEICGYTCQKAMVTLPEFGSDPFPVYYTNEIYIKNPNQATPYQDIDGVLLEFYLTLSNLKMKLVAENIYSKSVTDKKFERQNDYIRISKPTMERILDSLMVN